MCESLWLPGLEQSVNHQRHGGHQEEVVEDGGEDGAGPVGLSGVVGDEVGDEEGRETEGGVDERHTHHRRPKITVSEVHVYTCRIYLNT